MIINSANLKALYLGWQTAFQQGFRSTTPEWQKVATMVPSTTQTEEYGWLGQFPRLREWVGDRQIANMRNYGYTVANKDYEGTVAVDRNSIEDDRYGVYRPMMAEMGYGVSTHPDDLVFSLLSAAFTTLCYDGQFFVDTDHPVGSGTVSNSGGGSGAAWFLLDTTRPLKPLIYQLRREFNIVMLGADPTDEEIFKRKQFLYGADGRCNAGFGFWQQCFGSKQTLDITNYSAARAAMRGFKSDEGRPLNIQPNLLVVGPSNEKAALEITAAERNASGADNVFRGTAQPVVSGWLA